ncbi:MAG: hypothetical protein RLZZ299_192 [Pseudomonadota bacterium]|jgi:hypothetical protein
MGGDEVRRAVIHARLRWVGVVAFPAAACVLTALVAAGVVGALPPGQVLPGVAALGLSLGAFGVNNDTALRLADAASQRGEALPGWLAAELAHERRVRAVRLGALHASPRAAWILPAVSLGVLAWAGLRAWHAWGGAA